MNDNSLCEFYRTESRVIQSREIGTGRHPAEAKRNEITWCEHRQSSVDKQMATSTIFGATLLTCNGDRDNCTIKE